MLAVELYKFGVLKSSANVQQKAVAVAKKRSGDCPVNRLKSLMK
jgi:hypothetical protein